MLRPVSYKLSKSVYQEILDHFLYPSANMLHWDADPIFQQDVIPTHTFKNISTCFNGHGITVLPWPETLRDLNPVGN